MSFTESGFCAVCQRAAIGGLRHPACKTSVTIDGVFSTLVYKNVVKRLVYQFKYRPYLRNLEGLLTEFFYEGLIQKELFYPLLKKENILVPIPLHSTRKKQRGYNQAQLLANGLSRKFDLPVREILSRVRNTKTQVNLSQKERLENIKGAFAITNALMDVKKIPYVLLVDDVTTSGATLKEAAKVLKKAGVRKVWGLTLAHGE